MKSLTRFLAMSIIVSGVTAGATAAAAAAAYSHFNHPANQISRQFRDGTCLYKIIYGNFGNVPYATVHLYGGVCGTGSQQPYVVVEYEPNSGNSGSGDPTGGRDGCGSYIAYQATGPAGHIATSMWVYFPVTDSWKLFTPNSGKPTIPASPFC